VEPHKPKRLKGISPEQMALMEKGISQPREREFKAVEHSYGTDQFDVVLTKGYLAKILTNSRIVLFNMFAPLGLL